MENKNIDRLFQERLKNLEATPSKRVWNNIESKLTKKRRRVLPFWWFSGGIAALIVVGFFFFPLLDNKTPINNNVIITNTSKDNIEENTKNIKTIDSVILNEKIKNEVLIADEKTEEKKNLKKRKTINSDENKSIVAKNNSIKNTKNKNSISSKNITEKVFIADNSADKKREEKQIKKQNIENSNEALTFIENKENTLEKKQPKKDFLATVNATKKIEVKSDKNHWSVAPVFAILNSNSFNNSSSLDANLAASTKGENSYAYGVKVAYEINSKWTIQSGIQLQEMQYSNNQIAVISTRSQMSNISFHDGNSVSLENVSNDSFDVGKSSLSSVVTFNGNLTQNFGYVEIPVEIKYNLLEGKKFQTQIVGGFSSLFLRKNEIILENNSFTNSGEATNLNDLNFSGNFGFDFNYRLNKNWSLYVNPMFKAQLNTFSENANGFSPFNLGIYTGLNYQF